MRLTTTTGCKDGYDWQGGRAWGTPFIKLAHSLLMFGWIIQAKL